MEDRRIDNFMASARHLPDGPAGLTPSVSCLLRRTTGTTDHGLNVDCMPLHRLHGVVEHVRRHLREHRLVSRLEKSNLDCHARRVKRQRAVLGYRATYLARSESK